MKNTGLIIALFVGGLLTGCGDAVGPIRYAVPVVQPSENVRISYRSVEVRQVSLPEYAELNEISIQTPEGGIETKSAVLWADNPVRSVTLELSRNLGQITGATVASEPWPFEDYADARVEVRIEEMLTDAQNQFRLAGQYFVGSLDGSGRTRARVFSLSVPLIFDAGPGSIATARAQIIADLAVMIAKDGLR